MGINNILCALLAMAVVMSASAFHSVRMHAATASTPHYFESSTAFGVFGGGGGKKPKEDLSYIETRDMTREEMLEYNRQSETIMNQELIGMTVFSLLISAPLLYLAWVGFFAETNEIASGL